MVANFLPEGVNIILQSENGIMGMGAAPEQGSEDVDIVNAGAQYVTVNPGAMSLTVQPPLESSEEGM